MITIQEEAEAKLGKTRSYYMLAEHRLSQGLFMKVHRARSHSLQMSSAAAFMFSDEFSIIDANQWNSSDSFQFMVDVS